MSEPWEKLAEAVLAELRSSGESFWNRVGEPAKEIMLKAAQDIAKAEIGLLTGSGDEEIHKETIRAAKSTLAGESTLAALDAAERLKGIIGRALGRLAMVGLSLLG